MGNMPKDMAKSWNTKTARAIPPSDHQRQFLTALSMEDSWYDRFPGASALTPPGNGIYSSRF